MTSSAQFVLESYSAIFNAVSKEGGHYSEGPSHGSITFPINSKIGSAELSLPYFTDKFYEGLCSKVTGVMRIEPTLLNLQAPLVIVGDLHGSLLDFLRIIIYFEYNSNNTFLFLGDFVDRGQFSLEILTILYALKILYPKRFYMIRGNHEFENICSNYGFKEEIKMKSFNNLFNKGNCQDSNIAASNDPSDSVFKNFINTFLYMPLAAVIDEEIFCVHGGISPYLTSMGKLSKIERPISNYTTLPLIEDIMWADVSKNTKHDSYVANTRGTGTVFSETQLDHFFKQTGLKSVVRGHQFIDCGVEYLFNKKLVTLFSASSYNIQKGKPKNKCGALVIGTLPSRPLRRESFDSSSFDSESFDSTIESPSIISGDQNEDIETPESRSAYIPKYLNLNIKPVSHEAPIVQHALTPRIPAIAKPNEKFIIDDNINDPIRRNRAKSILDCRSARCCSVFSSTTPFTRANSLAQSQKSKIIDQIPQLNLYNSLNRLSSHCSVGNLSSYDNFLNSDMNSSENSNNNNNNSHQRICPLASNFNNSNDKMQDRRKKAKSVFISPSVQQSQCLTPRRSNGISCSHSMPLEMPSITELSPELAMQEFIFDSLDPLKFEEVNYVEKSRKNAPLCMKLMANEQKRIGYSRRRPLKSVEFVTGRAQKNFRKEESVLAEKV